MPVFEHEIRLIGATARWLSGIHIDIQPKDIAKPLVRAAQFVRAIIPDTCFTERLLLRQQ